MATRSSNFKNVVACSKAFKKSATPHEPRFLSFMEEVNPMVGGMALPLEKSHIESLVNKHGVGLVVSCIESKNCPPAEFFEGLEVKHLFMEWNDMSTPTVRAMLKTIEVVRHAVQNEGKKVVFHCFAGKGRTGTSIACSLLALSPDLTALSAAQVIDLVRAQRPGSIETKPQEDFIASFHSYLSSITSPSSSSH